jgi:hypothetical protein
MLNAGVGEQRPLFPATHRGHLAAAMRAGLRHAGHLTPCGLRKQIFGPIKQGRGFRQFLFRGFVRVLNGWALSCTAHTVVKLTRATA